MNSIKRIQLPMLLGSLMLSTQVIAMEHAHQDMVHDQHASMSMPKIQTQSKVSTQNTVQAQSKTQQQSIVDGTSIHHLSSHEQPEMQQQQVHLSHDISSKQDHAEHLMQFDEQKPKMKSDEKVNASEHANHLKEHGGQLFQSSKIDTKWLNSDRGKGTSKTEWESRIGTDKHKIFVQAHLNKAESQQAEFDAKMLYSLNVSDFWDVQAGLRYRYDHEKTMDQDQFDAVFGVQGLAPYFFETEIYALIGADDQYSFSLETERDILLTQKLILKPYINADLILSDHSKYALKSGLNLLEVGLETRYEINKKLMPYLDLSYAYEKGAKATAWQISTASTQDWNYGAGIRFRF